MGVAALAALLAAGLPFARLAAPAQGRVGAAVLLVGSGRVLAFHGGERFPMQSVYKFPIAMAALHRVDAGQLALDRNLRVAPGDFISAGQHSPIRDAHPGGVSMSLRELLRYAVAESDGTASDVVLRAAGGAEAVMGFLRGIGIHGVTVATTEQEMGRGEEVQYRNWATPEQMVALLEALDEGRGLSRASRDLLLGWMTETPTGPRRLKGKLPPGTVVAHKTGSSRTVDGLTRATNDVGLITLPDGRRLAVAVFVADSRAGDAAREAVIAGIARAAWDEYAGRHMMCRLGL